jgi:apolipoprotein N-acyltransferase
MTTFPNGPVVSAPVDGADAIDGRRLGWLAVAGATTMFLVQPPVDAWPLAWLAPLPWLAIVQAPRITAAHPWRILWLAGFAHWLATIHWLRLPHPATSIGWIALSAYLAVYPPLFIAVARRLVHGWRWPLVAAAPVAWMAGEQLRGNLLGGFTFGGLGHTQWRWTTFIQLADALGAVGVGGVVMAGAAALATVVAAFVRRREIGGGTVRAAIAAGLAVVTLIAATLAYGAWRLGQTPPPDGRALDVLLVQGSIDTELKHDPDAAGDVVRHYDDLTVAALAAPPGDPPDLIAWPETMWRFGLLEIDPDEQLPETVVEQTLAERPAGTVPDTAAARQAACRRALEEERLALLAAFAKRYGTHWLVGIDKQQITPHAPTGARHYNCGLFLSPEGRPLACYSKRHPVMFGEYVPLADRFPWLYRLTPLAGGLSAGTEAVAVPIAGLRVGVNICYETVLPEGMRALVRELAARGERPAAIVNLTNDGWFWGSSELDMHLTAAIFRAVELRTPIVVAANTGFSAWVDGSGRLLARGPRRATGTVRARVIPDGRESPWLTWGSLPLWAAVAVAAVALPSGWRRQSRLEKR